MWPRHYSFLSIIISKIGQLLLTEVNSRLAAAVKLGSPERSARSGVSMAPALLVLEYIDIKKSASQVMRLDSRRRLVWSPWGRAWWKKVQGITRFKHNNI